LADTCLLATPSIELTAKILCDDVLAVYFVNAAKNSPFLIFSRNQYTDRERLL
jgi:hypothetical protein